MAASEHEAAEHHREDNHDPYDLEHDADPPTSRISGCAVYA
jgi:hypothetical protein